MEAICVVLAITAFFMLALTLEAVIFGGMSLQLMVVTILGIILLILLALAFILVCARGGCADKTPVRQSCFHRRQEKTTPGS